MRVVETQKNQTGRQKDFLKRKQWEDILTVIMIGKCGIFDYLNTE